VVGIELAKFQDVVGERSDDTGLAAGVGHSFLGLSWDYILTDLPCKHSRWGS
jgi:hypothetical protein